MVDLFIPIGFKLPAYVILPLWFLQDFIGGIDSIRGIHQNVAFWAHVGGFAAGFGSSEYLQYGVQAQKEKLQFVAETTLEEYAGYGEGILPSEKLLESDPENPELHLGIARAKTRWRASEEGRAHYEKAIRLFLKVDPEKAAETFIEYWGKYFTLLEPAFQVRLNLLLEKNNPDLSAITLQSLIDMNSSMDLFMEEAHLNLARIYRRGLGRDDLARAVYEKFLQRFPETEKRGFVQNGDVYPCDFFVEDQWMVGNLIETPIHEIIKNRRMQTFNNRKIEQSTGCQSCEWNFICHCGCQHYRLPDGKNYLCDAYKEFFSYTQKRFDRLKQNLLKGQKR